MNRRVTQAPNSAEPIYAVRLLPEVRDAIEAYASEQNIPASVVIAEACRAFVGGEA